ncbi:MsnO8 family LLM class oxidoreductase [Actinosynnema sp. NPDC020468]|uniref:MsnO8 family LLM class oxidoreductase n=1 Tax=Actinosynnema sp. NPDC020468 TaxID=3154488 RepID=UPI0033E8E66A
MTTPLSVLDLSPVVSGGTAAESLRNSVDLARRTESFGYKRFWVAEHHLVPGVASSAPSVLIALIAAATSTIRVGSGAVLLGYYSPLSVAEQYGTIAALHPDRVDLGLGRSGFVKIRDLISKLTSAPADTTPAKVVDGLLIPPKPKFAFGGPHFVDRFEAQQELLGAREGVDYDAQVVEVLDFLEGTKEGFDSVVAHGAPLEVWVLGSSAGDSAAAAGRLGLPFTANYHVSPSTVLEAVGAYREAFVPSARRDRPWVAVSADVVVAPTTEQARELASPYGQWVLSIRNGGGAAEFGTPAEAAAFEWTDEQREIVKDRVDTQFVGTPDEVVERLHALRRAAGADELIVTTITHDHADRVRSYELLADAWR